MASEVFADLAPLTLTNLCQVRVRKKEKDALGQDTRDRADPAHRLRGHGSHEARCR